MTGHWAVAWLDPPPLSKLVGRSRTNSNISEMVVDVFFRQFTMKERKGIKIVFTYYCNT